MPVLISHPAQRHHILLNFRTAISRALQWTEEQRMQQLETALADGGLMRVTYIGPNTLLHLQRLGGF